jgi:hypothetical protein
MAGVLKGAFIEAPYAFRQSYNMDFRKASRDDDANRLRKKIDEVECISVGITRQL